MSLLAPEFWPDFKVQGMRFLCGVGLKSNHEATGWSHDHYTLIVPMGTLARLTSKVHNMGENVYTFFFLSSLCMAL